MSDPIEQFGCAAAPWRLVQPQRRPGATGPKGRLVGSGCFEIEAMGLVESPAHGLGVAVSLRPGAES